MRVLVTGGAGFIGSNFIRLVFEKFTDWEIINLDKLTYAGNPENIKEFEGQSGYKFIHGDICDSELIDEIFKKGIDAVFNFAAETHVDRSIMYGGDFIQTDVFGTFVLLEAAKKYGISRFIQISTDEVYGSIKEGSFKETDALNPSSPYSASKLGADRLAYAYHITYNLPIVVTRCSNNYGPYQYPEKFIPLFITHAIEGKDLPLYGDGTNVRDWIFVQDHNEALIFVFDNGIDGEVYNIGAKNEFPNLEIAHKICELLEKPKDLVKLVKDRPGHDARYSVDISKIKALGWKPEKSFEEGMKETVEWYKANSDWWEKIKSGAFKEYYEKWYKDR